MTSEQTHIFFASFAFLIAGFALNTAFAMGMPSKMLKTLSLSRKNDRTPFRLRQMRF